MHQNIPDALQQAIAHLRAGQPQHAQPLLIQFVKQNPDSEQGWFLLGVALSDPAQQADCFIRVLKINPDHRLAQEKLNQLVSPVAPPPAFQGAPSGRQPFHPPEAAPTIQEPPVPPPLTEQEPTVVEEVIESPISPVVQPTEPQIPEPPLPSPPAEPTTAQAEETVETPPLPVVQPTEPQFPEHPLSSPPAEPTPAQVEEVVESPPPPVVAPAPTRAAKKPAPPRRKKKKRLPVILIPLLVLLMLLLCIGAGYLGSQYLGIDIQDLFFQVQGTAASMLVPPIVPTAIPTQTSIPPPTATPFILPPTWTPTSTSSPTPIPSPTPLPTQTFTPTLPPPAPTTRAQMDRIQKEVSDLRGLPILTSVPSYLVTTAKAKTILTEMLLTDELRQKLHDDALVLSSLGLIKPTYDLENYTLNGLIDGIGGLYIPWEKEIYILGISFRGMEHFIYSHEFDHALTDQHFNFSSMGVYPVCQSNEQRCTAIRALLEGDATLLMYRWAEQYASPQDYREILAYQPPIQALPEQNPPPYVLEDLNFPYKYGALFVKYLLDRGNWAVVNKAYQRLPESTEQILHPEKYLDEDPPLAIQNPDLATTLGKGWRMLKSEVLGEWMTYLLLAYGADFSAQLKPADAEDAAQGWGGDHYLVYHSEEAGTTVLAALWQWDTHADAVEFLKAMTKHLDSLYRGAKLDRSKGVCWEVSPQTACLFQKANQVLWLITPDQPTLDSLFALYTGFR